jgi:hypothetical protein
MANAKPVKKGKLGGKKLQKKQTTTISAFRTTTVALKPGI